MAPAFSLGLGPCVGIQTTIQEGDVPAEASWLSSIPVGSAPMDTAPCEVIRAFNSQRLYIAAIYGEEEVRSSYQHSTQEQFISIQIGLKRHLSLL